MKALLLGVLAACAVMTVQAETADTLVIGNDLAEIVERLGGTSRLVGRDDSSRFPQAIANLPSVGYMRQLSAEGVLALKPQRLLISDAARPAIVLRQLSGLGLEVLSIARGKGVGDIPAKIEQVAAAMNLQAQAQPLLDEQRQLAGQLAKTPALKGPKALFIFNHAGMTPLIMGQGTEAQAALAQAGIENCATFNAYKQVAAEAMVSLAPDFVIVSRAGLAALGGEDNLWKLGGLAHTPAGQHRRLVQVDDQALLNLGPRTVQAMLQLRQDAGALFP
ncbi:ABC transporter substrate-binding protein [Pseudomonas sp. B21-032]|uniref:heme/hemin ABC transporter substrate-binding protein n=1 Tax=unclassified Pseudomonas TaxID=196821 RepID=UPI00087F4F0A|nr:MULTISPECIES: ABC transporter substrate-binding protein [unclassified Pseudomonas]UVL58046.1 ABC transporter substrate-binding protein [Pseudomonas sp. B21-035]UVL63371.1 ABC transporter substrate-binding protein [Pseudomonas sp. B21-032]SDQ85391.1 iron complex transport system substrate-binding protein [Pseudomonas sp. UC 17F4]